MCAWFFRPFFNSRRGMATAIAKPYSQPAKPSMTSSLSSDYDHTPTLKMIHDDLEGGWHPSKKAVQAPHASQDTGHIPSGYDFPSVLQMYHGNILP